MIFALAPRDLQMLQLALHQEQQDNVVHGSFVVSAKKEAKEKVLGEAMDHRTTIVWGIREPRGRTGGRVPLRLPQLPQDGTVRCCRG